MKLSNETSEIHTHGQLEWKRLGLTMGQVTTGRTQEAGVPLGEAGTMGPMRHPLTDNWKGRGLGQV